MPKDPQGRRWLLTINNPAEKDLDHKALQEGLKQFPSLLYYCMADEKGETEHTHVFFALEHATRFSTIKRRFPEAHIDRAEGTAAECRAYVQKSGKWADSDKAETVISGTFEEWGEPPAEPGQGTRTDIAAIYRQIDKGMSNAEIMAANPDSAKFIHSMDKIRQDILEARYRDQWRDLDVTYIFGPTATGKTRGVMEKHGYGNVYRVTDYNHPFDHYAQEPVMCFDEFHSSLQIGDMLDYLDGYPLALPARYANRQACFEIVYIISNIDLFAQYSNVQTAEPATWKAFLRRIGKVIQYQTAGPPIDRGPALEYIYPPPPPVPDWVAEAEQIEQFNLPF